jgi:predicted dehydrogenase
VRDEGSLPAGNVLRLGIVGCGDVAGRYAHTLEGRDGLAITAATDIKAARAAAFAGRFGGVVHNSLDDLLADDAVECVVNLTSFDAHADVTARSLEAGKHVHSEKPLALDHPTAQSLVELAARKERRLSCSPITFLGDAQQAAWRAIRSGRAGTIRVVYAEVNHGRIEVWHPRPEAFYAIGPLVDVAVYPLTILAAFFGPVRRVSAWSHFLLRERTTLDGRRFRAEAPDLVLAVVELESGPVARLTATFYTGRQSSQRGIEFHGDEGSIRLDDWQQFDAAVSFADLEGHAEPVAGTERGFRGIDFGLALAELAAALEEDRPHAASGSLAAHVVEVLCAIELAARSGDAVPVRSGFDPPLAPLSG